MITLEIDGKTVEVAEQSTVMDAASKLGIYVPHFCYHKKLSIAANCRMCLVQVEKAPKPLPACATPATDGMKVWTHSELAVNAQKGVMEFLLINHPLDCPICDQGGECQLQDLAVGYGGSNSRFHESKRVVAHKDLGPLVSAEEMSRCIHCTRCVRFGQEIAGIMELGMAGRGEHSEIMAFVGHTVDSELSGNMIDVCPVGALTSKPFRYSARTWELSRRRSIAGHDSLGSNVVVQVKQNRVMRVLPRENEAVNECWLSDRDRFSYEGLNSDQRLTSPMIKRDGRWVEVNWQTALEFVTSELSRLREAHGPAAIGALATAQSTSEELYLLQKLLRAVGSGNVDFRLRQHDFSGDGCDAGIPSLGMRVSELDEFDRVLLIGSNVRKEHPLLAARLRQAVRKNGAHLNVINSVGDDFLVRTHGRSIVSPANIPATIAAVMKAAADKAGAKVAPEIAQAVVDENAREIAESLLTGENKSILLGSLAQHHPQWARIRALAELLGTIVGARIGVMVDGANTVGGYLCGALPEEAPGGLNARAMIETPLKAYVLLHAEVELDTAMPRAATAAMHEAELVVALSPYKHRALEYAQVLLPVAPFTETAGTYVNLEGKVQNFNGVVPPLGDTRPAWKVLRVLGNLLQLEGFGFESIEEVRDEMMRKIGDIGTRLEAGTSGGSDLKVPDAATALAPGTVERIGEVPIYHTDGIVRRADSLQQTRDARVDCAWMNSGLIKQIGLDSGDRVRVSQDDGEAVFGFACDDRLPDGCVRIAAGSEAASGLATSFGGVRLERLPAAAKVES